MLKEMKKLGLTGFWILSLFVAFTKSVYALREEPARCGGGGINIGPINILSGEGVDTAIGCIPVSNPVGFVSFFLRYALGIAGGIIVLMIIITGYQFMFSGGNPEKLQAAKENVVAIFSGVIMIIFSLVLLRTIGANILLLPTF